MALVWEIQRWGQGAELEARFPGPGAQDRVQGEVLKLIQGSGSGWTRLGGKRQKFEGWDSRARIQVCRIRDRCWRLGFKVRSPRVRFCDLVWGSQFGGQRQGTTVQGLAFVVVTTMVLGIRDHNSDTGIKTRKFGLGWRFGGHRRFLESRLGQEFKSWVFKFWVQESDKGSRAPRSGVRVRSLGSRLQDRP